MKFIFFLIIITTIPLAQKVTIISGINLQTKKNGIFIKIHSDQFIDPSHVTGWQNREWFYITIHQALADTALLENSPLSPGIKAIECSLVGESVQLGFNLVNPIEQFEFYITKDTPGFIASLRFPLAQVLAALEADKIPAPENIRREKAFENQRYRATIKALYFIGLGLTTGGLLAREDNKGWEIPVGMGFIAGAYVYDNFIHEQ